MEGDQEKPRVFKPSNSWAKIELAGGARTLPISLTGMRGPPNSPFCPWGWVLMARGVVH